MAPVIPSPPAIHLPPTLDSTFLTHADELRRRLAGERTSIDTVISAARDIEAQATMAIHKRQAGDESGALADASDAALALWSLRRSGVAESVAHRSAVAHAATAVATLQILETFLQTGTLGARPRLSADWTPRVPEPIADGASADASIRSRRGASMVAATPPRRRSTMSPQLTEPQASPYTYNGLVLYLSDDSTTGYAGVTRMASAPDMARPYVAAYESSSSPESVILGWFATAVEAAMAYARHVKSLEEGTRPGDAAASSPSMVVAPSRPDTKAKGTANGTPASNGTQMSNGMPASNSTPMLNGTTPISNGTTPMSNGTTPASNGTTPASKGSSATPRPKCSPPVAPPVPAADLSVEYQDGEWLHALMRSAHEIGRYAVGRAAHADGGSVRAARDVCAALLEGLTPFDLRDAGLATPYDDLVRAVRRLEEILYELSLATDVGDGPAADGEASRSPSDALIDVGALEEALQRRAAADAAREATVRRCHELSRLSKAAVSTLHRGQRSRAEVQLAQVAEGCRGLLLTVVGQHPELRQHADVKSLLEGFLAARLLVAWAASPGRVLRHAAHELGLADVGVDEYLCAVAGFASELGRYAVSRATARDAATVRACLGTALCLRTAALRIGTLWPLGRETEMEAMSAVARNVERLLYEQSLLERTSLRSAPHWEQ